MDSPAVEVAAALIFLDGRYLITQRRQGSHLEGLWEFPGGKRQAGESLEACLRRELREELNVDVTVGEKVYETTWEYPQRKVVLHFFRCQIINGAVSPAEGQAYRWIPPQDLVRYVFPPADAELVLHLAREGDSSVSPNSEVTGPPPQSF